MALLLLYPLVPESPHWLAVSGDVAGADAVLRRMAAVNGAQMPPGRLEGPAATSATSAAGEGCHSLIMTNSMLTACRLFSLNQNLRPQPQQVVLRCQAQ